MTCNEVLSTAITTSSQHVLNSCSCCWTTCNRAFFLKSLVEIAQGFTISWQYINSISIPPLYNIHTSFYYLTAHAHSTKSCRINHPLCSHVIALYQGINHCTLRPPWMNREYLSENYLHTKISPELLENLNWYSPIYVQMMGDEFPLIIPVWCITEGKKKKRRRRKR